MPAVTETIDTVQSVTEGTYKWGFETEIEMEFAPKGLNEDIVRFISKKKNEPEWLLAWRLKAFAMWQKRPTSTMPVSILMRLKSYKSNIQFPACFSTKRDARTV